MDFGKLSSSEKMAVYAAVVVAVLAIYALAYAWGGLMALSLLGAIGVLVIIFLPQMSPGTTLPGSRGSLMLIAGGVAAVFWALTALVYLGYIFRSLDEIDTWIFLVGFAAALWLGLLSWRAFQAEGGKLVLGSSGTAPTASSPAAEPTAAHPPAPQPAAAEPAAAEPTQPPPAEAQPAQTEPSADETRDPMA